MNKEQVLEIIKDSVQKHIVTRQEVIASVQGLESRADDSSSDKSSIVPKVLYTIGGVIAVVGVVVLLANNWSNIGFGGRWLVTVGFGLATFISAFLVYKKTEYNALSQVFFSISAITMFIGGFVWIDEVANTPWDGPSVSLLVSFILLVIFGSALYATKKKVLHGISTIFFTIAYYSWIAQILKGSGFDLSAIKDVIVYASMILAVGYLMYGSWIHKTIELTETILYRIYTFCAFALFMGSALFLGGIWNFLYAFLAIGAVTLSINLKSRIGLVVSSIAIGVYCIKISVQYFADSISFSLALLCSGLLIIGLGYLTYYLNKKYIKQQ